MTGQLNLPYTFRMEVELSKRVFLLPNAKRMVVEPFGIRITDKSGNTIREYPKREVWFDVSLNDADRRLLSWLKISQ
jgi:hypothetical protein